MDDSTFGFEPQQPAIAECWDAFYRFQCALGGEPFVGRRLAMRARSLGCNRVGVRQLPVISSALEPGRRDVLLDYLRDLLLSAQEATIVQGYATAQLRQAVEQGFSRTRSDPNIHFGYSAVRLGCAAA